MLKTKHIMLNVLLAAGMLTLAADAKRSVAQDTASVPKPQDNLALGEGDVGRLMLLIGPNKNGKITKQAWMRFMSAEFDRLDKDKSGTLDAEELAQSRLQVSPFSSVGK